MQSYLGPRVEPAGWLEWSGNYGLGTLFYGEYMNHGPGAGLSGRVRWPGYHIIRDPAMAGLFTVRRFIDGLSWLPNTGVIFMAGLDY
jgi:pectinesterase